VAEPPGLTFAGLLRRLRAEAQLTQEELAEAAGLSPRSVSDLERGINRTARKDTAQLLADALSLAGPVRELFVAAARGRGLAADVLAAREGEPGAFAAAASRTLPRDIASFTGRQAELAQLLGALAAAATGGQGLVEIHAIGGMAGVGKTTFAVHAAHLLAPSFPDGQYFLPLHAHTRGQRPVDPADALGSLLLTAGLAAAHIPPGLDERAARWRDVVAGKKILLLLDDAAGHEQVRPLLPGTAGSLVLVTSRRRLTALDDAAVISLGALAPGEAAALLARLAARPGIRATDVPVGEITRLCGHLPLAIGMLARQLSHHPARTAIGMAASLTAARDRLALIHAENLSVAAAFDLSYADLAPGPQRLFRRLGLVPGPSIDAYAAALDDTSLAAARRLLDELYDQHLLAEPAPGRYILHDLLREHARALAATANPDDTDAATRRLLDYCVHAALAASRRIPTWTDAPSHPLSGRPSAAVPDLSTFLQAITWLEAEWPNLHAAADHAAAAGRPLLAVQILPAAIGDFLRACGHWDQAAALHRTALAAARRSGDKPGQALALLQLGILSCLTGDLQAAAAGFAEALALYEEVGDQHGQALALIQVGVVQQLTGHYPAALASCQQALDMARGCGDRLAEAHACTYLGDVQRLTGDHPATVVSLQQALNLYRELDRPGEADALVVLGVVQQETGDYLAAAASIRQVLGMYRDIGDRNSQAWALDELGTVEQLTGDHAAAAASHQQALNLYRDVGHRIGQAEALNSLGELSCRTSATAQARAYHAEALAIARELGLPLQQARALEGTGRSHLRDNDLPKAARCLQQALTIYQRITAPAARCVQETLHDHGLPDQAATTHRENAISGSAAPQEIQ
jgi:tetratricopeptide (TPR) repeat protein/transcriptional regulator with XRE-family HTH domain